MALKGSRNTLTLVLALALATAAAIAIYVYSNGRRESEARQAELVVPTPTPIPMTDVLIATQDIAADTTISADMVAIERIALADKNQRALSAPGEAVGKVAVVALDKGEQILDSRVAAAPDVDAGKTKTFAYEVPVGKRAISINNTEVIAPGGLVQPGDWVDVIGYFSVTVRAADRTTPGAPPKAVDVEKDINVATYVIQDVEVLAVAQALTPDQAGVAGGSSAAPPTPTPSPTPNPHGTATAVPGSAPDEVVARPEAKSVTLAVSPEQAQRLLLATQLAKNQPNDVTPPLRLVLRAPGDHTVNSLPPLQDGVFPIGDALKSISQPMVPNDLAITDVQFSRRVLNVGDVLDFTVTVKNISEHVVKSGKAAPPKFTYTEGTAYDALGYVGQPGTYRLGLNVSDAYPTQFPYRWSLGRDLKPGESITIAGSVKMTQPTSATKFWFGIILEPNIVTQDGAGVAEVSVLPSVPAAVGSPAVAGAGASTPQATTPEPAGP